MYHYVHHYVWRVCMTMDIPVRECVMGTLCVCVCACACVHACVVCVVCMCVLYVCVCVCVCVCVARGSMKELLP